MSESFDSESYDTYDSFDGGEDVDCCEPLEPAEPVEAWVEEPAPYVAEQPAASVDVAPFVVDLPEPVTYDEPVPTAASSASGPGLEADAPTIALVGGSDPYGGMTIVDGGGNDVDAGTVLPATAVIGGNDGYGGMTIVDASGTEVPGMTSAVIGGPDAWTQASIGYTADIARFEQLSRAEQKAEVFGGPPELWANQPSISVFPTPGESVNDTSVRSVIVSEAAEVLARIQDAIRNPD